jgi:hypothetical protein
MIVCDAALCTTCREDAITRTAPGARYAKKPLVIETPIMVAPMSYGALGKLEREDLRSVTLEACAMTGIPFIGSDYTFGEPFGFFG